MERWQRRRILILGKTYPSYSRKYMEVACTGGLFDDTLEMVRLFPMPFRYIEKTRQFVAWQYIDVDVERDLSDPRPESYRIRLDSIELSKTIPPTKHDARCKLLERSPNYFKSVEELLEAQRERKTSLGIVKPAEIIGFSVEPRAEHERDEWELKEQEIFAQKTLMGPEPRKLDFPEAKFFIQWRCDDASCTGHKMSIHQWGIHELYRKLHGDPNAQMKLRDKIAAELDDRVKDIYLFLGNFRGTMYNFGLMDSYSAKKQRQLELI